jgi:formyltetrahydrofolate deformylase
MKKITLLIHCKDRPGIISAVTSFISSKKGNIVYIDQHVDSGEGIFFMRLECEFEIALDKLNFYDSFSLKIASQFQMQWELYTASYKPKMAIFVSKYDHCLHDLLGRFRSGELAVEIPFVVSNHLDLRPIVESFNIPFYHTAVDKNNKDVVAKKHLELLKGNAVDFVVLARYMQIIPKTLIDAYPNQIINIHHSFLPAFVGAKPYHSAFERGVKIIGATSHYVTEDLDAGPIIAQDVSHVSHTHSIKDLIAKGRDLEKIVLATAVQLHLKRKVMTYNNKTVIFS